MTALTAEFENQTSFNTRVEKPTRKKLGNPSEGSRN
jgi:hypothetical protein